MQNEILYIVGAFGLVIFVLVLFMFFKKTPRKVQSKEEKRVEILREYKQHIYEALIPLADDSSARVAKKSTLLKQYSDELSRNIFFDRDEIREILLELSEAG